MVGLASGLQGYLDTEAKLWERPVLFFGGLMMIYPGTMTDVIGLVLSGTVVALSMLDRKRQVAKMTA